MTNLGTDFAPYAPPQNILDIIARFRSGSLAFPPVLTHKALRDLKVPEASVGRVRQTFQFLKLVDEDFRRTEKVDEVSRASSEEYPAVLARIVRDAYQTVFESVDPATASDEAIRNVFRRYTQESVRKRMQTLFLTLCEEAGIVPKGTRVRHYKTRARRAPDDYNSGKSARSSNKPGAPETATTAPNTAAAENKSVGEYDLIKSMIGRLPKGGKWTIEERNRWLTTFQANLDYEVKVENDI